MNVLAFDIETVPDVASGRRLLALDGLGDVDVARIMRQRQQQASGTEMMRHHLNPDRGDRGGPAGRRSISGYGPSATSNPRSASSWSDSSTESSATRRNLVSWNGSGFDLPVLHYRALLHGVGAPRYWESGDDDQSFRWNNYLNRFHARHTDLMDVLAGYQPRAFARLDEIAQMLGFPGKLGDGRLRGVGCIPRG